MAPPADARDGDPATADAVTQRILHSPSFQELVRTRTRFAWTMSGIMLAIYLGFIFLVAFAQGVLAVKVGTTTSLGIVLGVVVILAAFALTGIYVQRANGRFDELTRRVRQEAGR